VCSGSSRGSTSLNSSKTNSLKAAIFKEGPEVQQCARVWERSEIWRGQGDDTIKESKGRENTSSDQSWSRATR
jgi:hypothetical protein